MEKQTQVVLAVDDSAENLNVITGLLNEEYKVKATRSGVKALEMVKANPPDLILLDINMPEMDGYQVIQELKKNHATKDIPVIFLTALSEVEDEAKGFALGAADYISKPFNPLIVRARVHTHMELVAQRRKTEELLENILPKKVIHELKETGISKPDIFENVSILFSDIVDFTANSASLTPEELIAELSSIFSAFDENIERNRCERIKTIGDAYFAVSGLHHPDPEHAVRITHAALECIEYLEKRNSRSSLKWQVRVGVHCGRVVGGIVGTKKFIYDVFGDTVNTASRVETSSVPMRLTVSADIAKLIHQHFLIEPRGPIELKGKGLMDLFFVSRKMVGEVSSSTSGFHLPPLLSN